MEHLALKLPGMTGTVAVPQGAPSGGMSGAGARIVSTGISILLSLAVILALFYLIYGGFQWMTSGGDQDKLGGARQTMIFAIIGLTVSALSFLIIQTLGQFFGLGSDFFLSVPKTS